MNQFFEKYPWLRTMLCGLMAAALLLSVLLPVLRLQRQEPENPIREENIQPVEPLSFGEAEGGTRLSAPEQTEDGPGGGQTQPENAEQPTAPEETDPIQDPQPAQPQEDPNQQQPGNEVPSDGMGETQPGEDGTEADDGALDLGLVLSWKRYGSERYRSLCPANRTVRQDVRTAQIPDGQFGYELELQGLDAGSAEIIAVQIAENGGNAVPADIRGGIAMRLGSDGADSYYTLQVQASVTRVLEDGSRREELVTFAFLLVYSDSLDLEAEFQWLCADGKMDRMLCQPDARSVRLCMRRIFRKICCNISSGCAERAPGMLRSFLRNTARRTARAEHWKRPAAHGCCRPHRTERMSIRSPCWSR